MKLIGISLSPKKLFRSKKSRSLSRSEEPSSFSSGTTSSDATDSSPKTRSAFKKRNGSATPVSVLPSRNSDHEFSHLPAEVYLEIVQAFRLIDRDGDGKIPTSDLQLFLSRVGDEPPSQEELRMLLDDLDSDGDGCLNLEDLGQVSSAFGPPSCGDELRVAFDFFDADHDGRITAEELFDAFSSLGGVGCTLEDCRRMIMDVDQNEDGFVCFEDFSRMMQEQQQQQFG